MGDCEGWRWAVLLKINYYSPEMFSESFGTLTNSQTTFRLCTPKCHRMLRKPATLHRISMVTNQKVYQGFLGAEIDFFQNSKRFGKMKAFYTLEKLDFFWKWFLVFLWDNFALHPPISEKIVKFHQNCLTKRLKSIFRKNQNFPTCKMLSFSQIFWNFGKRRSQLRESLDKRFCWLPLKSYVALQVFEAFCDTSGYRAEM